MLDSFLIKYAVIKSLIPATNLRCFGRPTSLNQTDYFTTTAEKAMKRALLAATETAHRGF